MDLVKMLSEPWAILPSTLQAALDIIDRTDGKRPSAIELGARASRRVPDRGQYRVIDGVAEIPIYGPIAKSFDFFDYIFGDAGTTLNEVRAGISAALSDADVHTILLDIDSPGGTVSGVPELADVIEAAGQEKPVVAFTDGMMASAAYWLGSAASKVVASKAAQVGSIGVFATVTDLSVRAHQMGMKREVIKYGKFKGGGTQGVPLDADTKVQIQQSVDTFGEMFDSAVKARRSFDDAQMSAAGEGRLFIGAKAQEVRLIDAVASYEDVRRSLIQDGGKSTMKQVNGKQVATEKAEVADELLKAVAAETIQGFATELAKLRPTTAEALETEFGSIVAQIREKAVAGVGDVAAQVKAKVDEAIAAERQRAADILASMFDGQQAIATTLVMRGMSATEASDKLAEDRRRRVAGTSPGSLTALEPDGSATPTDPKSVKEAKENGWRADYAKDPNLRKEFSSADRYVWYMRGKEQGSY